jgi:hypothetical protein
MILFALSFFAWATCAVTGFMSLACLLVMNSRDPGPELPRGAYLGISIIAGTVSFYLFHQLGGPRQW